MRDEKTRAEQPKKRAGVEVVIDRIAIRVYRDDLRAREHLSRKHRFFFSFASINLGSWKLGRLLPDLDEEKILNQ